MNAVNHKASFGYKLALRNIENAQRWVLIEMLDDKEAGVLAVCVGKDFAGLYPNAHIPLSKLPKLPAKLELFDRLVVEDATKFL